ncbi:hypothetical protein AB0E12_17265 [Micromonospora chersina]|uniref:hypothetical protein n=1 Tax=Micromonospora chersina TaxID=47854 RepID=UPI003400C5B9
MTLPHMTPPPSDATYDDRLTYAHKVAAGQAAEPLRDLRPEELPDRGLLAVGDRFASQYLATDFGDATQTANEVSAALAALRHAIDGATAEARATIENDELWPDGRWRKLNEKLSATDARVKQLVDQAETAAIVAEATATLAALPPVERGEALIARNDAAMLLGGVKNDAQLAQAVQRLAQRDDSIGRLVTNGAWLADYLASRGLDQTHIEALTAQARAAGLQAATRSLDTRRAQAARAVAQTNTARKAAASMRAAWEQSRGWLDGHAKRTIPKMR